MPVLDRRPARLPPATPPPAPGARIPKLIHYVWVGPRPLPERDAAFIRQWRALLPGWEFRFWNNETADIARSRWLQGAYAIGAWNRISDYLRLWALARHGGVYLDTDVELLRPLDPLLRHPCFIGFQADTRSPDWGSYDEWVNGAVIGAEPGHWFVRECLDTLLRVPGWQARGSWTGPGVVTEVLERHGLSGPSSEAIEIDGVTIYPTRTFYPYPYGAAFTPDCVRPDTLAIHHWAATWTTGSRRWPLSKKLMLRLARLSPSFAYRLSRLLPAG